MKEKNTHDAGLPHDGSDRKKSVNELKRKGAVGLALFLAYASGEEDPLRAEEKIQRNADSRAKVEKARIKTREAAQERRKADKLADAFLVRAFGLKLPATPSVQADIDSILGVDSSHHIPHLHAQVGGLRRETHASLGVAQRSLRALQSRPLNNQHQDKQ